MNKRQRQRKAKQYAREALKVERQYYREIRKAYKAWLSQYIQAIAKATGYRLDADVDPLEVAVDLGFLAQLANDASNSLGIMVQRFSFKMRDTAKKITGLSKIVWGDKKPVDLVVNPLLTEPWLERELAEFTFENAKLITKVGQDTIDRISIATLDNLKRNQGRKQLAETIRKIDKTIGVNRAKLIARDQIGKLNSNLTAQRAKRAGVEKYEWQTMGDNRVRPSHKALDGTVREFGKGLEPGQDVGCRCVPIPLIE